MENDPEPQLPLQLPVRTLATGSRAMSRAFVIRRCWGAESHSFRGQIVRFRTMTEVDPNPLARVSSFVAPFRCLEPQDCPCRLTAAVSGADEQT